MASSVNVLLPTGEAAGVVLQLRPNGPRSIIRSTLHSRTPPRNRLAKVLPDEWRAMLVAAGCPKRKYTAVCRATLVGGRVVEDLIIEEGWIIALSRDGLGGIFEQRIDFDPRGIVSLELKQFI